jgi:hypothetical protein
LAKKWNSEYSSFGKGNKKLLKIKEELTYELLEKKRKELLDLLSVDEFLSRINKK